MLSRATRGCRRERASPIVVGATPVATGIEATVWSGLRFIAHRTADPTAAGPRSRLGSLPRKRAQLPRSRAGAGATWVAMLSRTTHRCRRERASPVVVGATPVATGIRNDVVRSSVHCRSDIGPHRRRTSVATGVAPTKRAQFPRSRAAAGATWVAMLFRATRRCRRERDSLLVVGATPVATGIEATAWSGLRFIAHRTSDPTAARPRSRLGSLPRSMRGRSRSRSPWRCIRHDLPVPPPGSRTTDFTHRGPVCAMLRAPVNAQGARQRTGDVPWHGEGESS
jgi:hypothetical protein